VHSATQILALKEWKVGSIKMFNHKPLLVSDDRSLLSCCTVSGQPQRQDQCELVFIQKIITTEQKMMKEFTIK
jgi:hypothetical protein